MRGWRSSRSWASSRADSCRSSSRQSCGRTRRSTPARSRRDPADAPPASSSDATARSTSSRPRSTTQRRGAGGCSPAAARAGSGGFSRVSGESGLGKPRLADEVASRAKDAGLHVLWGRSAKAEGAPAYWLWSQALQPLGAELPEVGATSSESARFQLFVDVAGALRTASAARPIFLVLDDLHHADAASLLLLDFLAGELAEMHLAVVGTYAEDEATPASLAAL